MKKNKRREAQIIQMPKLLKFHLRLTPFKCHSQWPLLRKAIHQTVLLHSCFGNVREERSPDCQLAVWEFSLAVNETGQQRKLHKAARRAAVVPLEIYFPTNRDTRANIRALSRSRGRKEKERVRERERDASLSRATTSKECTLGGFQHRNYS